MRIEYALDPIHCTAHDRDVACGNSIVLETSYCESNQLLAIGRAAVKLMLSLDLCASTGASGGSNSGSGLPSARFIAPSGASSIIRALPAEAAVDDSPAGRRPAHQPAHPQRSICRGYRGRAHLELVRERANRGQHEFQPRVFRCAICSSIFAAIWLPVSRRI